MFCQIMLQYLSQVSTQVEDHLHIYVWESFLKELVEQAPPNGPLGGACSKQLLHCLPIVKFQPIQTTLPDIDEKAR